MVDEKAQKFEVARKRAQKGLCVGCGKALDGDVISVPSIVKESGEVINFQFHRKCFD